MSILPDTNPKTRFGMSKPGISSIPPSALLYCGQAMDDGKSKYGLMNWREHEVSASVYYNAAFRHLAAWYEGEQVASDSGVHHLGHVMACCAILLDAELQGALNDDRPAIPGAFADLVKALTKEFSDEETDNHKPEWAGSGIGTPDDGGPSVKVFATEGFAELGKALASAFNVEFGGQVPPSICPAKEKAACETARNLGIGDLASMHEVREAVIKASNPVFETPINLEMARPYREAKEPMLSIDPAISMRDVQLKVFQFMTDHGREWSTPVYDRFRDHLGNRLVAAYTQMQRTRLAFYLDAASLHELTDPKDLDELFDRIAAEG